MNKDYERLRQDQVDSINSWAEYLSNKDTPFPTWFKIYAFDSVIKMGTYNHKDGKYEKRDKSTIAPYPNVSPAALALTLDAVNNFFGQDKEKWFTEHTDDDQLNAVVKSGNFGKIYTHFFNETYKPIPTPERTEDIEGEWFDFLPGQETELAEASQGTPWCIASEHMGEHYLKTNDHTIKDNKARFELFKLKNENSIDGMSKTACASIRFDTQGRVAEVSGLANGSSQAIEDSLVPVVEQEAFKYPLDPEKYFKEKFRDKKELIRLQDKAKKGEELTLDEYAFLYEKDRKIFTLDTHGGPDPKIAELRNFYNLSRLLQSDNKDALGQDMLIQKLDCVLENTDSRNIIANLDTLLEKGIDINTIFDKLDSNDISQNFDTLLEKGIDINTIFDKLDSNGISQNLYILLEKGIDVNTAFNRLDSYGISKHLDTLLEKGINVNDILDKLGSYYVSQNLNTLLEKGIDVNSIFDKLDSNGISQNFEILSKKNIPPSLLISKMNLQGIETHLDTIQTDPANIKPAQSVIYHDIFIGGIENFILENISEDVVIDKILDNQLDSVIKGGNLELAMNKMMEETLPDNLKTFLEQHPIDFNSIKPELYSKLVSELIESNVDSDDFAKMNDDRITRSLIGPDLIHNLNNLLQVMPIDRIVANMRPADIETYHDELVAHGATL